MKNLALAALIGVAMFALSACSSNTELVRAQVQASEAQSLARIEEAKAAAAEAQAVKALADRIDAGGASAYLIAKAMKGIAQPVHQVQVAQPRSTVETIFGAVLQVADVALRAYGIKSGADMAIAATNATRDTSIASYGAFTTMGGHIATAGTAGYPYVQAPAPNVTLSGTGVIGAGTYTGPVTTTNTTTTTRTCSGGTAGQGAAGGGVSGGGAGGSAPGGTC
jgi:hypothetical protein